jgi:hypothetical protein
LETLHSGFTYLGIQIKAGLLDVSIEKELNNTRVCWNNHIVHNTLAKASILLPTRFGIILAFFCRFDSESKRQETTKAS